jgi:hypothetical protein
LKYWILVQVPRIILNLNSLVGTYSDRGGYVGRYWCREISVFERQALACAKPSGWRYQPRQLDFQPHTSICTSQPSSWKRIEVSLLKATQGIC